MLIIEKSFSMKTSKNFYLHFDHSQKTRRQYIYLIYLIFFFFFFTIAMPLYEILERTTTAHYVQKWVSNNIFGITMMCTIGQKSFVTFFIAFRSSEVIHNCSYFSVRNFMESVAKHIWPIVQWILNLCLLAQLDQDRYQFVCGVPKIPRQNNNLDL